MFYRIYSFEKKIEILNFIKNLNNMKTRQKNLKHPLLFLQNLT